MTELFKRNIRILKGKGGYHEVKVTDEGVTLVLPNQSMVPGRYLSPMDVEDRFKLVDNNCSFNIEPRNCYTFESTCKDGEKWADNDGFFKIKSKGGSYPFLVNGEYNKLYSTESVVRDTSNIVAIPVRNERSYDFIFTADVDLRELFKEDLQANYFPVSCGLCIGYVMSTHDLPTHDDRNVPYIWTNTILSDDCYVKSHTGISPAYLELGYSQQNLSENGFTEMNEAYKVKISAIQSSVGDDILMRGPLNNIKTVSAPDYIADNDEINFMRCISYMIKNGKGIKLDHIHSIQIGGTITLKYEDDSDNDGINHDNCALGLYFRSDEKDCFSIIDIFKKFKLKICPSFYF